MKKIILMIISVLIIFCANAVFAYDVPDFIRVGLCFGSNARTYIELFSNEGFDVGYYEGNNLVSVWSSDDQSAVVEVTSGELYISYGYETYEEADAVAEGGFVMYTSTGFYKAFSEPHEGFDPYLLSEGAMAVKFSGVTELVVNRTDMGMRGKNNLTMIDGYSYRGGAEMRYAGSGIMTIINVVGFTDYVCGVVPYEMPVSFEPEALKVQAVCARNYAVISMGRFDNYGFDVTDDVTSQVYGGVGGETEKSNIAVRETDGMMLMYEYEPAQTYFSSMSGGHTEACKNVWYADIPYLCGVEDPYEDTENIQGGIWEVRLTPEEIADKLAAWGESVGQVTDMYVDSYTDAGGVYKLVITGTEGTAEFTKDDCRNLFALKSQKYTVSKPYSEAQETITQYVPYNEIQRGLRYPESSVAEKLYDYPTMKVTVENKLFGTYEEKTVTNRVSIGEDVYLLSGRGYGHGLGMSQWGAQGMAQAGYGFEEILLHYFPGTTLLKD